MKTIIPNLVSFETDLKYIKGFYFSEDFDFYDATSVPHTFHYKITVDPNLQIPEKYEFRNGYYTKAGNVWYYNRKIKWFSLKFAYNTLTKEFTFNQLYTFVPFELGGINPVGRLIADIINLELFMNGFTVFRGCAVRRNNETNCIIGISFNGKTTYVKDVLKSGGKYISEDFVILDLERNEIYPVSPYKKIQNFARASNRQLITYISTENVIKEKSHIDNLFLVQNSTVPGYQSNKKTINDFLLLSGLSFLNSRITRSIIVEEKMRETLFKRIDSLNEIKYPYKFINIKDFNFNELKG